MFFKTYITPVPTDFVVRVFFTGISSGIQVAVVRRIHPQPVRRSAISGIEGGPSLLRSRAAGRIRFGQGGGSSPAVLLVFSVDSPTGVALGVAGV
jgi:hypothetical protein